MAIIYVNLHPSYTYSNIIIQEGFVEGIKAYVKAVDWLSWDWTSLKNKPIICVHGGFSDDPDAIKKHLERTEVFLQRISSTGDHELFIRDERGDEWQKYRPERSYSADQLFNIEIQKYHSNSNRESIKRDMEKYSEMLKRHDEPILREILQEAEDQLYEIDRTEQQRRMMIKELWQ